MQIKVLLADNQTLFRQALRALLGAEADIEIVASVGSASETVARVAELKIDIVLMEISMPGLSSFQAIVQMRKTRPETRVLLLTMYDDEDYLVEGMEAGASGYILKDSSVEHLLLAIRDVSQGGTYISPRMLTRMVDDFRAHIRSEHPVPRFDTLTNREVEVLKLLAEGNSVKEIASGLEISLKTVETHKFNLMRKLDIHNKVQLVQYAIQKKIIRLHGAPEIEIVPRTA